jgi:putative Mg2+ transporter-C (MgtC) family protein
MRVLKLRQVLIENETSMPVDLDTVLSDLFRLALAYLLAVPIGWNRERRARGAGIRTFPIVAIASCGLALVGVRIAGAGPDAYSRILQGLITGIGFVGGGAILKERGSVSGTATAASVWNIGIVGAAVGFGTYHVAVLLSLVNWLTLKIPDVVEDRHDRVRRAGPSR